MKRMETYLLPVRTLMDVHNLATAAENIPENLDSITHQHQTEVPQKVRHLKNLEVLTDGTQRTRSKNYLT